tara:strand:- start:6390 stop:6791 length:402 start_codon:yes stop_codon:yes gene_type:complete
LVERKPVAHRPQHEPFAQQIGLQGGYEPRRAAPCVPHAGIGEDQRAPPRPRVGMRDQAAALCGAAVQTACNGCDHGQAFGHAAVAKTRRRIAERSAPARALVTIERGVEKFFALPTRPHRTAGRQRLAEEVGV